MGASQQLMMGYQAASGGGPPSANLVLNLDASTLAGGNALITNWTATTGPNASNAGGAERPTSITAGRNGLNTLRFGAGPTIATSAFGAALTQPYSIIYVGKLNTVAVTQRILSGITENGGARFIQRNDTAPVWQNYAGSSFQGIWGAADADTNWHVIGTTIDNASGVTRIDNGTPETVGGAIGTASLDGLRISGDYDGTINPADIDIGQILVYSVPPTFQDVFDFLQPKWGF